jgi:hypothetical protein
MTNAAIQEPRLKCPLFSPILNKIVKVPLIKCNENNFPHNRNEDLTQERIQYVYFIPLNGR